MQNEKKLVELTLEELYEKRKKQKMVVGVLCGFMAVSAVALIVMAIKSKNYALIAVASGCSVTMMPLIVQLGQINGEIKKRQSNG